MHASTWERGRLARIRRMLQHAGQRPALPGRTLILKTAHARTCERERVKRRNLRLRETVRRQV
jgi:hypothetical protein